MFTIYGERSNLNRKMYYLYDPPESAGRSTKNRNVDTKTIGGYVRINGIDSFIGVVVRIGGKNRYYVHRVILPDGAELIFDNKKTEPIGVGITANGDKRSTISSVNEIIPDNGNESNGKIKKSLRDTKGKTAPI